jgi:hypothetical protein
LAWIPLKSVEFDKPGVEVDALALDGLERTLRVDSRRKVWPNLIKSLHVNLYITHERKAISNQNLERRKNRMLSFGHKEEQKLFRQTMHELCQKRLPLAIIRAHCLQRQLFFF